MYSEANAVKPVLTRHVSHFVDKFLRKLGHVVIQFAFHQGWADNTEAEFFCCEYPRFNRVVTQHHVVIEQHHPFAFARQSTLRPGATAAQIHRIVNRGDLRIGSEILRDVRRAPSAKSRPLTIVAVLRAGLGLIPALLELYPDAAVGHIGLYRDERTLNPIHYYVRLPKSISKHFVILCDPMLATGGSACEALKILKANGAKKIALLTLLSAKQGVDRVQKEHADVEIFTAAVDAVLDSHGYIVPGLGDAGDRLFNT